MREVNRFDPIGWFVSAALAILTGVIALAIAIHLLQSIWTWLMIVFGLTVGVVVLVQVALWWHRRRSW